MSQIQSATAVETGLQQTQANRFSEMTSEDFVKIIFTELTNQDPLEPNDTSALLEQLNSIRSIESDMNLASKLESLVTENQIAAASTMIGKVVTGLTQDAERVTGIVLAAAREGDDVFLDLSDGSRVGIGSVESITDASMFREPGP